MTNPYGNTSELRDRKQCTQKKHVGKDTLEKLREALQAEYLNTKEIIKAGSYRKQCHSYEHIALLHAETS